MTLSFQRSIPAASSWTPRRRHIAGGAVDVLPRIDTGKAKYHYITIFHKAVLSSQIDHPNSLVAHVVLKEGWTFRSDSPSYSGTKYLYDPDHNPVLYFTLYRHACNKHCIDLNLLPSSKQSSRYLKTIPEVTEQDHRMLEQQTDPIQKHLSPSQREFSHSLNAIAEPFPNPQAALKKPLLKDPTICIIKE